MTKNAGDPKFKPLHDELIDLRKLLFAFRMIRYNDMIPDLSLNIKHRNAELVKPLLRLFSSRNDAPVALEEIRHTLSKVIAERNELEHHRDELLKLPIGKGPMEIRIDYAIQQIKRMMAAPYDEDDNDEEEENEDMAEERD